MQQPLYTLNNLTEKEVKLIGESRVNKRSVKINMIGFAACVVLSVVSIFALMMIGEVGSRYSDLSLIPLAVSLIFMGRVISIRDKAGKSFLDMVRGSR